MNITPNVTLQEALVTAEIHSRYLESISNKLSILSYTLKTELKRMDILVDDLDVSSIQGQQITTEFLVELSAVWEKYQARLLAIDEYMTFDIVASSAIH